MNIISTFFPPENSPLTGNGPSIVMAFDTLVGQKSDVVGITVGRMNGPDIADVVVSDLGQTIIDRCARHLARNYPQGAVVVAGVASVTGAKERVRQVLTKVPPESFVLFLCANDKVYDAAFPALGVDLQSANINTH